MGAHSHSLLYGPPPATPDAGDPTDDQLAAQGAPKPVILASPPTNESTAVSGPYPTLIRRPDGRTVPVVTAMWASRYLGVLNTTWGADGLESAAGSPVLLGGANSTNPVAGAVGGWGWQGVRAQVVLACARACESQLAQ